MRALTLALLLALVGCSSDKPKESPNVSAWKPGSAVVVLVADVDAAHQGKVDLAPLGERPGVIAAWGKGSTLRVSFGRQAKLVDMAALKLELARTPGLSNVREVVVAPDGST
jgi:hypothetical protein